MFGSRFLRFMSGPKSEGEKLAGNIKFSPENAKINFICPNDVILQTYNPLGYEINTGNSPGLVLEMINKTAEKNKKISRTLSVSMVRK